MQMNSLSPAFGAKRKAKRVGRGIGSGKGKTCGRGHKGQTSRAGSSIPAGFEGGQMPLQRRVPKFGFKSRKKLVTAEIRLPELAKIDGEVTIDSLRAANIITGKIQRAKIINRGKLEKAVTVKGLSMTPSAKAAIEAAGGKIVDEA